MKNRSIFAVLPLVFVIFGLFAACDDATNPDSSQKQKEPWIVASGKTLTEKLQWLYTNAESNSRYLLEVATVYEEIAPQSISYPGRSNITVQLKGTGSERIIGLLGTTGSLLSIGNGVTLILDDNLTLVGKNNNTASLVTVASGGTLIMNKGAKITGNGNSASYGAGVFVVGGGTFTMSGGEISGNTATYSGGGVLVAGTFTMSGGEISGNTSCGGVYVNDGGTFTISGGKISGNTTSGGGGGVYVRSDGTFTKSGGTITGYASDTVNGNKAGPGISGHAVYVASSPVKRRDSTAGPGVNMDSTKTGVVGGWE